MSRHETSRTTRQEWQERSAAIQEEVNEKLESLAIEVDWMNMQIAKLHESDPELIIEFANNAVRYLDEQWGHIGDNFLVTGSWYHPSVALGYGLLQVRHEKEEVLTSAPSNGFTLLRADEMGHGSPRVGLSFSVAQVTMGNALLQGSLNLLAFADIGDVSLHFLRPANLDVVSSDLSEVMGALVRADSMLALYTNHEDSSFYRQNAKKQEAFLRSIADSVQDALPAPDSMDRLMLDSAQTQLVFIKDAEMEGGLSSVYPLEDGPSIRVSGHVVGVVAHDVLTHPGKHYASPADLGTASVGLSLMVRPESTSIPLREYDGSHFLLPIRLMDDMPLRME